MPKDDKSGRRLITIPEDIKEIVFKEAEKENRSIPNYIITKLRKQLELEGKISREE